MSLRCLTLLIGCNRPTAGVFPFVRAGESHPWRGGRKFRSVLGGPHLKIFGPVVGHEITEMLRVPRRVIARSSALDQAQEGHLVDALALRGDEGRSTLR